MRAKGGAQPIGKNQTTLFLYKGPVSIPTFTTQNPSLGIPFMAQ